MTGAVPFPYAGDPALQPAIEAALRRVVDPEMSLNIVDMGLVYGVDVSDGAVDVRLTMTSAACPVAELIIEDAYDQLLRAVPDRDVNVQLCWEPPWGPERMTPRAREILAWD